MAEYLQDWLPLDVSKTDMTDWKMAQWAAQRLKRQHDKPFFLACGFYRPHVPLHAPREYYDKFPLDKITLPRVKLDDLEDLGPRFHRPPPVVKQIVEDELTWRKGVQAYLASINFADECVGLLLNALDASRYRDNTIVMLWSDHGLHQGEKFRFSKFTLWEESAGDWPHRWAGQSPSGAPGRQAEPGCVMRCGTTICTQATAPISNGSIQ